MSAVRPPEGARTAAVRVILQNLWSIRMAIEVSVKEDGSHDAIELRL